MITELRTLTGYLTMSTWCLQIYWCRVSSRPSATTALIPWWWIWDIPLTAFEAQESAYVSMIVVDVLAPSKHQDPSNHNICNVMWIMHFVLCYIHENIFCGVGLSVTRQFLYYWWVSILTMTLSHATRIQQHLNTSMLQKADSPRSIPGIWAILRDGLHSVSHQPCQRKPWCSWI